MTRESTPGKPTTRRHESEEKAQVFQVSSVSRAAWAHSYYRGPAL